jgi:hypothetical protein
VRLLPLLSLYEKGVAVFQIASIPLQVKAYAIATSLLGVETKTTDLDRYSVSG